MIGSVSRRMYFPALLCALVLGGCVVASGPWLEMGVNDDWSYIWMARGVAHTGRVVYNGWAAPMLGWQLYLGALFIKLFGFSFTAVRCSMLVLGMATAALLERLFVRFGANEWNATIATLMLALSPLMMPLSFIFMSDLPGFFCVLLCVYLCAVAVGAERDGAAAAWVAAAAGTNLVGGTARQVAWLGLLVVVPCALWLMRRRRPVLLVGSAVWAVSVVGVLGLMRWVSAQPYFMSDKLLAFSTERAKLVQTAVELTRGGMVLALLLVPVLAGFAVRSGLRGKRMRGETLLVVLGVVSVGVGLVALAHMRLVRHLSVREITPFFNNMVTARGMVDIPGILGQRPEVVPLWMRIGLIVITVAALAGCWLSVRSTSAKRVRGADGRGLPEAAVWTLLGPYTAVYVLLLISHGQIYDRYLLPLFFVAAVGLIRVYQERVAERLPVLSVALVALVAVFSTACLHDLFALDRARLTAANEMLAAGVPRAQFRAGFEYDSWTQLEMTGYINDERIRVPAGVYRAIAEPPADDPCQFWFTEHTPEVQGRFGLSYEEGGCGAPAFQAVRYRTWLMPGERWIYVKRLR